MIRVGWELMAAFSLASAGRGRDTVRSTSDTAPASLGDVTEAEWRRLADRRVFFGRQSVCGNIDERIPEPLAERPQIKKYMVERKDLDSVAGPALVHAATGRDPEPKSKSNLSS